MRRLLLMRHSKAAPSAGGDDYDRSLTEVGKAHALLVGELIASEGMIPDILVYSSAERTRQTAQFVATTWPRPVKCVAEHGLYEATRHLIFMLARALPPEASVAMLVGHNPGIGDIANQFAGSGGDSDRTRLAAKFPTSALAVLDFPGERWADIEPRAAKLSRFVTPGDL